MRLTRSVGDREVPFFTLSFERTCGIGCTDRKVALRILDLVEAVLRDPFAGVGKPEPQKFLLAGAWARRITDEHRLVYVVRDSRIDFVEARYHY